MKKWLFIGCLLVLRHWALAQPLETTVQRGHTRSINSLAFSPDGRLLVSASDDHTVKLWEVVTGRELRTFNGHKAQINKVLFHPNGEWIVSASSDHDIKVWEVATGKLLKTYTIPEYTIMSLAMDPTGNYLAAGSYGDSVYVFNTKADSILYGLKGDRSLPNYVDIDAQGKYLIIGHDNRRATLHDLKTGNLMYEYKEEGGYCGGCPTQVRFVGSKVTTSSHYKGSGLRIRDLTGKTSQLFTDRMEENTLAINFSPDNKRMVTADEDSVVVWEANTGKFLFSLNPKAQDIKPLYGLNTLNQREERYTDQFTDAVFSPDGNYIATADNTNFIILWDAKTGQRISTFYGYLTQPGKDELDFDPNSYWEWYSHELISIKNKIVLAPDGIHAFRSDRGKTVKRWDLLTGKVDQLYSGHEEAVVSFTLNQAGDKLLTAGGDRTAKLWEVSTGKLLKTFKGHRDLIYDVAFSHDQTRLLTACRDGWVFIWEVESGELVSRIHLDTDPKLFTPVYVARFSPNDLYVFTGVSDGILKLWEIDTGREVRELIGHTDLITDIEFSLDERTVISTSRDHTIRYWDLLTGMQLKKLTNSSEAVYDATFDEGGQNMLTSGADRVLRLYSAEGRLMRTFTGHKSAITSVHFSPDKRFIISGSIDGVVKVWNLESGEEVLTYFTLDANDWLTTNTTGNFFGTDGASKQVFFVQGTQSFELDRFFKNYYNPNLLKEAFGDAKPAGRNDLLEQLKENPTPDVAIQTPENESMAKQPEVDVLVKATNTGGGLKTLKLLQNGKVVEVKEGDLLAKVPEGKSLIQKFKVHLLPGRNTLEAIASNRNDIESRPDAVDVLYNLEKEETTCFVLSIGINHYENPALNLNYAQSDAKAFTDEVRKASAGLYDRMEVHELYDTEATRSNIMGVLDALSIRIKPGDVFYFYYAGHGTIVDDEFYFVPTENVRLYSKANLAKDGISATEMREKFTKIKAVKQIVLMDACQSGGATELLATRGAMEEKAMAQLSRSAGIHVLSAAGSEQFATEYKELGHGLFTYVLLEALKGKADGAPQDGVVSVYELKSYIDALVPEYSKKYKGQLQYPYTFSRGQDFPVTVKE